MSPDDPRHGTEAGHREHYRHGQRPCAPCLEAHRRRNIMRKLYPHKRPALGSQRRIQALQALGYGRDRIASELGYTSGGALTYLMQADTMLATTAERIADVYDALCMTVPTGVGASRARTWAKRHGFAPPLAWNDIDDANEQPRGWRYTTTERADMIRDLADLGANATEACRRLKVSRDALERWCQRNGMADVYRKLAAREAVAENQHTREDVA